MLHDRPNVVKPMQSSFPRHACNFESFFSINISAEWQRVFCCLTQTNPETETEPYLHSLRSQFALSDSVRCDSRMLAALFHQMPHDISVSFCSLSDTPVTSHANPYFFVFCFLLVFFSISQRNGKRKRC